MGFSTAGKIIGDVLSEIGVVSVTDPSTYDPWAATDPAVLQATHLLRRAGQSILRERNWTYLRREHSFTTVEGVDAYDWPSGFLNMIDQTGWVRSTRLPLQGPLSPQEWQYLTARLVGSTLTLLFRPMEQQLYIFPSAPNTPGGLTIAFEYQHSLWVQPDGAEGPTLDAPSAATDTVWFDEHLIGARLRLEWLKAKGFDLTEAKEDYRKAFDLISNDDSQAAILNLAKRGDNVLMGERNVPITGFGG